MGYGGGYAEYALACLECVVPIPDGVYFAQTAAAMDSIATAYHAVVAEHVYPLLWLLLLLA